MAIPALRRLYWVQRPPVRRDARLAKITPVRPCDQSEANERRNCGFSGPRWSGNQGAHFAWCLLSPRQAEEESRAREAQLRDAAMTAATSGADDRRDDRGGGDRVGKRAHCDTYSKIAEVQADANQKYDCGFRGGEWIPDARPHFAWCMRHRRDYMLDEIRFRAGELQKCFNKLGDYDEKTATTTTAAAASNPLDSPV